MNIKERKALNHLFQKRIILLLKNWEDQGEISEKEKDGLFPSGSKPRVLCGLTRIYKVLI